MFLEVQWTVLVQSAGAHKTANIQQRILDIEMQIRNIKTFLQMTVNND